MKGIGLFLGLLVCSCLVSLNMAFVARRFGFDVAPRAPRAPGAGAGARAGAGAGAQPSSRSSSSSSSSSISSISNTNTNTNNDGNMPPPPPAAAAEQQQPADRAKKLSKIHRYRGKVDQGYGRGGKKLGVPTANLPASLFQNALEDVNTGVYFGWAALEDDNDDNDDDNDNDNSDGNNVVVYKAVVNVGYSPTFEGKENQEKIIEAHLILEQEQEQEQEEQEKVELPDFYGVPMRLQLIGWLRDEQKFDSFPELIAQINADVQDAKNTLDCTPYQEMKRDDFFFFFPKKEEAWIGTGGGDATASWEFSPVP